MRCGQQDKDGPARCFQGLAAVAAQPHLDAYAHNRQSPTPLAVGFLSSTIAACTWRSSLRSWRRQKDTRVPSRRRFRSNARIVEHQQMRWATWAADRRAAEVACRSVPRHAAPLSLTKRECGRRRPQWIHPRGPPASAPGGHGSRRFPPAAARSAWGSRGRAALRRPERRIEGAGRSAPRGCGCRGGCSPARPRSGRCGRASVCCAEEPAMSAAGPPARRCAPRGRSEVFQRVEQKVRVDLRLKRAIRCPGGQFAW